MNPDQLSPHDRETQAGWVLVPVEPTDAMTRAAVVYANGNAVYKNVAAEALRIEESIYAEVYAAMLAARPSPPASQPTVPAECGNEACDCRSYCKLAQAEPRREPAPSDCPHAAPFRYCPECPVTPCPVDLGRKA